VDHLTTQPQIHGSTRSRIYSEIIRLHKITGSRNTKSRSAYLLAQLQISPGSLGADKTSPQASDSQYIDPIGSDNRLTKPTTTPKYTRRRVLYTLALYLHVLTQFHYIDRYRALTVSKAFSDRGSTVVKELSPDRPEVLIQAYLAEKTAWLAQHPTVRPAEYRKARKWKNPRPKVLKEQAIYMSKERRDLTGNIIATKAN
jgi:hypothetical protein